MVKAVAVMVLLPLEAAGQGRKMWCLRTDKGEYIEMARVVMLASVGGEAAFEVVVRDGASLTGVGQVTFRDGGPGTAVRPLRTGR